MTDIIKGKNSTIVNPNRKSTKSVAKALDGSIDKPQPSVYSSVADTMPKIQSMIETGVFKEQQRNIHHDNIQMLKRLQDSKSTYNVEKW